MHQKTRGLFAIGAQKYLSLTEKEKGNTLMHLFRTEQTIPCQWESLTQEYSLSLSMNCDFGMHKKFKFIKLDIYLASNDFSSE